MRYGMKSKYYNYLFIILLFAGFVSACSDDDNSVSTPSTDLTKQEQIDNVADSLLKNIPELTAIILGIWDNENNFSYEHAYGTADTKSGTPANVNMLSRVASVTKTFVGTVALQLVDEGTISLDDKVTTYLPEYPKYSEVSIKSLLDMTSGIPDYSTQAEFSMFLLLNMTKKAEPAELVDLVYDKDFLFTPGSFTHGYSSTNTILLGMILEKVCNETIGNLIETRILTPLNLQNSFFATTTAMPTSNVLHGYYIGIDFLTAADPSWAWAAGSMVSDIYDLKTWLQCLVKGNPKLLISDSLQQMRFVGPPDEFNNTYGCGLGNYGNDLWGHGGKLPGYETIAVTDRHKDRTFVIFFNTMNDTRPHYFLKRILEIIGEKSV